MEIKKYVVPTAIATGLGATGGALLEVHLQKKHVINASDAVFEKFESTISSEVNKAKYLQMRMNWPAADAKRISGQLIKGQAKSFGGLFGSVCLGTIVAKNIFSKFHKD